ncbi:ATP-dependent Lon protease [Klebsormidium nitens]|uniref:endopeptidase La n=1 Tax=Klebsormidium nitens TaxID=105231 RepID=A0A1Y1IK05_KLENI|nr:ATP-dependent Lon protease [Klebsormidium nitens]|eukprot:GAQ89086.1 ATP-dependent Lon protease [Klebsormidium nitens]
MAAAAKFLARGTITCCPIGAPSGNCRAPSGVRSGLPPAPLPGFSYRASRSQPPFFGSKVVLFQQCNSSLSGLSLFGERSKTGNNRTFPVRRSARRSAVATAGRSEPYPHFTDEPSSFLPALFDGDLRAWLPAGFTPEDEEVGEEAQPANGPVKVSGEDGAKARGDSGDVASIPTGGLDERRLPSQIVIPAGAGGPVPVVVQLSEDTLELLNRTQAPPRQSVFMYLATVLTKGASSVLLLGGSAIISVAVSLMVLERAGVLKPLSAGIQGPAATQAGGMPKVVIRKTVVRAPSDREEVREDEVDSKTRPISVTQLPDGWTQERFGKMGKDVRAADKYWNRLRTKWWKMPAEWLDAVEREVERLARMHSMSTEHAFVVRYLDWMTLMPWGETTRERYDVAEARNILEEDHYGLEEVKERLLEFIAVSQLKGTTQGRILLLHGPPGVGKTSIAKSMARALNRKFHRMSVGGLNDPVEFKGHNRTYVGSEPGKVVGALKQVGVMNPLVLIDEVDKMAHANYRGDPGAALLEILDPEQNKDFKDHYMEVGLNLSQVLFVCTANDISQIARPLLDRMETIELSGYSTAEKVHIAKRFLLPKIKDKVGLAPDQVEITDAVLEAIATKYTFEAGCRGMERQLEKICRKIALELVDARQAKEGRTTPSTPLATTDTTANPGGLPNGSTPPGVMEQGERGASSGEQVVVEASRGEGSAQTADGGDSSTFVGGLDVRESLRFEGNGEHLSSRQLEAGTSGSSVSETEAWNLEGPPGSDAKSPLNGEAARGSNQKAGRNERGVGTGKSAGASMEVLETLLDRMRARGEGAAAEHKVGDAGRSGWRPWGNKKSGRNVGSPGMEVVVTGNKGPTQGRQADAPSSSTGGETSAAAVLRETRQATPSKEETRQGLEVAGNSGGGLSSELVTAVVGERGRAQEEVPELVVGTAQPLDARATEAAGARVDPQFAARVRTLKYQLRKLDEALQRWDALRPTNTNQAEDLTALLANAELPTGEGGELDLLEAELQMVAEVEAGAGPSVDHPAWPLTRAELDVEHHARKVRQLLGKDDVAVMAELSGKPRETALWLLAREGQEDVADETGEADEAGGEQNEAAVAAMEQVAIAVWAREKLEGVRGEWAECRGDERHTVEAALGEVEMLLLQWGRALEGRPAAAQAQLDGIKAAVDGQAWAAAAAQEGGQGAAVLRQHAGAAFPQGNAEGVVLLRSWWRALERHWRAEVGRSNVRAGEESSSGAMVGEGEARPGLDMVPRGLWQNPESKDAQRAIQSFVKRPGGGRGAALEGRGREVEASLWPALHVLRNMYSGQLPPSAGVVAAAREMVQRAAAYAVAADSGELEAETLVAEWLAAAVEAPRVEPLQRFADLLGQAVAGQLPPEQTDDLKAAFAGFKDALAEFGLATDWTALETGPGVAVPADLDTDGLLGLHVAAVLYNTAVNPGCLEGLTYPRLTQQQGDAWNLAFLRELTPLLLRNEALYVFDGRSMILPDGYNMRWPGEGATLRPETIASQGQSTEATSGAAGAEFGVAGLSTEEQQQLRVCARAQHWLAVLEGPFRTLTAWPGYGAQATRPRNPNEGALLLHGFLLADLQHKRTRYAPLFDKLAAQGCSWGTEIDARRAQDVGRLLGFSGRTPLEWALVSRKVPLQWKPTPGGAEPLLLYEEPAVLKQLQGGTAELERAPPATDARPPLFPHLRLPTPSPGELGRGAQAELTLKFLESDSSGASRQSILEGHKKAADAAAHAQYAAVRAGQRSPRDVLRLRLALMHSAQAAYAVERMKAPPSAELHDGLELLDLDVATRDALGEQPPLRTSGQRWRLGDPLEELFPGQALPAAAEVDLELVRAATAFFERWRLFDAAGGWKRQADEGAQAAAGFLEALLHMNTERAVRSTQPDALFSQALDSLQAALMHSFAKTAGPLRAVVEAVFGSSPGQGGLLGVVAKGKKNLHDAKGAVLLKACRAVLWSPELFYGPLLNTTRVLQLPAESFGDVREQRALRQLLFDNYRRAVPGRLLNRAEGGALGPLLQLKKPARGQEGAKATPQERARGNPHVEAELYELLWAYLRERTEAPRAAEQQGGLHRWFEERSEGVYPKLSAADLGVLNPHAAQPPTGTIEALQRRQRAAPVRCATPRVNLVVEEDGPQSTGTRLGDDARGAPERAEERLPGGSGRERHGSADRQGETLDVAPGTTGPVKDAASGASRPDGGASAAVGGEEAALRVEAERTEVVLASTRTVVGLDNLRKYLGRPKWGKERWYAQTPTGVVMGLVTTQAGGQIAYIEASLISKSAGSREGSILATGQMGDVLKESTTIAHSVAARVLAAKQPDNAYFDHARIHVHMPEGATPKDGPSAGVTLVTALLSLAMDKPVRPNLSMTGEITLVGRVLPVGGIKEKVSAARRAGVQTIILPAECAHAWDELADDVTAGLEVHFAETYEDVFRVAFDTGGQQPASEQEGGDAAEPALEGAVVG